MVSYLHQGPLRPVKTKDRSWPSGEVHEGPLHPGTTRSGSVAKFEIPRRLGILPGDIPTAKR